MEESKYRRINTAVLLGPVVLFQVYVVAGAYRNAEALRNLLTGLGAEVPAITQWFLDLYKFLPAIPALSIFLGIDLIRREHPSILYSSTVVFASLLAAFVMQAWANEAWFVPMFRLIKSIG